MSPPRSRRDGERLLTALAHPLRRRLLDLLAVEGPATVSMLSARTGEAVGNVSHHLRVLGAAGLLEEAPELARDRRERWWRRGDAALTWSATEGGDDPAALAVGTAAETVNLERQLELLRRWWAERERRDEWRDAAFSTDEWLRLTPHELAAFAAELNELVERWRRLRPDDDAKRDTVFVCARGFPAQP